MNVAILFAGGVGSRFKLSERPKQFVKVKGVEILVHTINKFNDHDLIDGIILVVNSEWMDYTKDLVNKHSLNKVRYVVEGGKTGQESIFNGIECAHANYDEDTIVLIHDGVRPVIDSELITNNIKTVEEHSNSITVAPAIETIIVTEGNKIAGVNDRSRSWYAKAPQCFYLKDVYLNHITARKEKINTFIDTASLMSHYGTELHITEGSNDNIKVTTNKDYFILKAILKGEDADNDELE